MYISQVEITDICCFKKIQFDLESGSEIDKLFLILGDNGTGKTTILRCIAMGLCEEADAWALAAELYGEIIRYGETKGTIKIWLKNDHGSPKSLLIETTFYRIDSGYKITQKTVPKENFPWKDIFVCGYGAARFKFETRDYSKYETLESVFTLFNYDAPLQNPELILRRLDSKDVKIDLKKEILPLIEAILMLDSGSLRLTRGGVELSGPWGTFMPMRGVGDGHKAILSVICDLLGWGLFYDDKILGHKLSGIVLLDEIEQHLHPSWQKEILRILKKQFPHIQFIITSHSPLCAIGTTDLKDEECQLMLMLQKDTFVDAISKLKPPRDSRADQVLTSYLFGLETSGDSAIRRDIVRYSNLGAKKRTQEEEDEFISLQNRLNDILGQAETELERKVATAVKEVLEREPNLNDVKRQVLDYEVKRQLKELFGDEIKL